jgi:signal transduction histidine kinase
MSTIHFLSFASTLSLTRRTKNWYEEAVEQSLTSAGKITKILDSMKWLIRLVDASYKKERIDLTSVLPEIIQEFEWRARERNLELHTKFPSEPFILKINRAQLEIAVGNIMKNAIKYSNELGQIYVSFDKWILRIQDFWVGISRENLENIFDRYFRENYIHQEGYGLGLALVKKISDLNGWKVSITSEKSIGTTVSIIFS